MRFLPFLILFLMACEVSTDWELTPNSETQLVVEAILTNENKIQEIRLSQTYANLNDVAPSVENAKITVHANRVNYVFLEDTAGIYKSETPFAVLPRINYELVIQWADEIYTASSRLSSVAPIPKISFDTLVNSDKLVLENFAPLYNPNQQAMYEIDIDWSLSNQEEPQQAKIYLYTFSDVHLSGLTRPRRTNVSFPKGSRIIVKKYGLNEDFADYLRAKAIETEWSGAVFYSTAENLPTNINNNALGFYSTCAVLTDTLIAE